MPVFNEANRLSKTLTEFNKWINDESNTNTDYELIIIDDGSTDRTCEIILEFKNRINITLINNEHHGQFFSIITGVKKAKNEYVVTLEADLSAHPKYVHTFLQYIQNYAVVYGSRLLKESKNYNKPLYRKIISYMYSKMFRFFFKTNLTDPQIALKIYKRQVFLKGSESLMSKYDGMKNSEILLNILGKGNKIKEIPIEYFHSHSDRLVSIRNNLLSVLWKNLESFIIMWISCKQKYRNKIYTIDISRFCFFK